MKPCIVTAGRSTLIIPLPFLEIAKTLLCFTAALLPCSWCFASTPAFPGAEGAGANAAGGRGGRVLLVTNLNDSGPGSLRAAVEASGRRIVVFRVAGLIALESPLTIDEPFITIAGQTAPGLGICVKNYPVHVTDTHDVIIRYMRTRLGDERKTASDALSIDDAQNVIIDHCSASWSVDETLSVTKGCDRVTVQWCLITESLNDSCHHKGPHGYGSIIAAQDGHVTFHHNLYAHHNSRNPRPGGYNNKPGILLDFRNNLIYNWGMRAGYNGTQRVRMNYVGNYLKPGPSTHPDSRGTAFLAGGPLTSIYANGNLLEGQRDAQGDDWSMIALTNASNSARDLSAIRAEEPFQTTPVHTDKADICYDRILKEAGATFPVRDAVDNRILQEVRSGRGRIINSQKDVGGWPAYPNTLPPDDSDSDGMPDVWEKEHRLDPSNAADNIADPDKDGYTNIEECINGTNPNAASRQEQTDRNPGFD